MLSTTNSLNDMQLELEDYGVYGYTTQNIMNADLTIAINNARDNWMFKYLSRGTYDNLAYLDRDYFIDATVDTTAASTTCTMDATTNVSEDMYVSGYGVSGIQVDSVTNVTTFELKTNASKTATNSSMLFSKLSESELNIYWAEINFARSEFMQLLARLKLYHRKAANESISEGGITHSTSGKIGPVLASKEFIEIGQQFMRQAGYDIGTTLQRGNSYHYNRERA